jgi:hypothetical protein
MSIVAFLLAQVSAPLTGVESLHRLDLLPVLRSGVKTHAVTSYDRTGGNDDGFSGKYSFVRKEGEHLVLADLKGPGCITRIHTPTPTDDPIEFYFDGETTPRVSLPFRKLFTGEVAPFRRPLVDYAGGGYTCYIPMPYAKSCKVVLRGKHLQFYDLNFSTYPSGTSVQSFDPKAVSAQDLDRASAVFNGGRSSDLTAYNVPPGSKLTKVPVDATLEAGKTVTLYEAKKGGRIASLRLGPAEAFAGKDRDILLRVTWDGDKRPAILMPVGDFFGYAWGKPAMGSALVGTFGDRNYCNLPMPFDRSAKIELVSLRNSRIAVKGELVTSDAARRRDEGKFYAVWRRENPTTEGKPFTWLDTTGRGHIVGLSVHSQGIEPGNTFFFEGDDKTVVDGEMLVHGTGSEDFFNGGWYDVPGRWDAPVARALSGCMAYQRYLSRTGGYRFLLNDAYRFDRSIMQTIEHAPTENKHPADYCGVTYLYSEQPPAASSEVPSLALRQVVDPSRLVYTAHWTMPIESFSLAGSTLSRGEIPVGDRRVRALSLRAQGQGDFDLCFVGLRADIPSAGRYKVYIDAVKGPEAGKVQLFREEAALGEAIDLYAEKPVEANGILVGEFTAVEGGNVLMFKIIGKNPAAKGLGLDLVNVVCVKQ